MTLPYEYQQRENETSCEYKFRLIADKVDKIVDLDWAEIRETLGLEITPDTLRKQGQGIREVYRFYEDKQFQVNQLDSTLDKNLEKELKAKLAQSQLSSEKSEINKWIREYGRSDLFQKKLIDAVSQVSKIDIPKYNIIPQQKEYTSIFPIADQHYGKKFTVNGLLGEILNEYSVEIFEKRMWDLFNQVVTKIEREKLDCIHLFNLSDSIDGILRASQLKKIELGLAEQIIGYSEFMANWLNELSKYAYIDYTTNEGNHTENRILGSNKGDFPEENVERIITWYLQTRLKDNHNIKIHNSQMYVYKNILGLDVLATHGQDEKKLELSVKDYMITYGRPINLLLTGHLHSTHNKTIGTINGQDIDYYQVPAICGADDYAIKLKKSAKAGAKMFIVEKDNGISTIFNFKLN